MIDEILTIYAFYPTDRKSSRDGALAFQTLAQRLTELSPWMNGLRFDRASSGGIDVLAHDFVDQYEAWSNEFRRKFPEDAEINAISATAASIDIQGGHTAKSSIVYLWGIGGQYDQVHIEVPIQSSHRDHGIPTLRAIIRVLTEWQKCLLVISQPSEMKFDERPFPGFHTSGTGIWLTYDLSDVDLIGSYAIEQIMGGTLILPVDHVFNLDESDMLDRVTNLDEILAQHGLLPEISDFPYGL